MVRLKSCLTIKTVNERPEILNEIKQAVLEVDPGAEVVLFGSRARGDFHDESDWDVLVLVDKDEKDYEFKRKIRNALFELQLNFGAAISTVIHNKNWWRRLRMTPFYWEVEKDGLNL